ncbi:hypothetical protein OIU85_009861 [Salix viminalis]|uniref:LysM domain-containing protein n=1 Tax=Salix viminalis TaxID=40686 RepID=A0A9Q0NVD8_SALVM|nr:hypothetical protein OIU85_009861 [Salix viminalis]
MADFRQQQLRPVNGPSTSPSLIGGSCHGNWIEQNGRQQEMAGEVDQQGPRGDKGWKRHESALKIVSFTYWALRPTGQPSSCVLILLFGEMSRAEPVTFEITFVAFKNGIFVSKMAARNDRQFHLHYLCFLAIIHANLLSSSVSDQVQSCDSYLYHISDGLSVEQIASFYSAKSSNVEPITLKTSDYLLLEM